MLFQNCSICWFKRNYSCRSFLISNRTKFTKATSCFYCCYPPQYFTMGSLCLVVRILFLFISIYITRSHNFNMTSQYYNKFSTFISESHDLRFSLIMCNSHNCTSFSMYLEPMLFSKVFEKFDSFSIFFNFIKFIVSSDIRILFKNLNNSVKLVHFTDLRV